MILQEIGINFEQRTKASLLIRAQQAVEHLLAAIQEAYYKGPEKVIGSHGGSGAIGSLSTSVKIAGDMLTGIIGSGPSATYFRYLEYGVKPASSDPAAGQAYNNTPAGGKFALAMSEWTRRARLTVPISFYPKAERSSEALDRRRRKRTRHAKHRASGLTGEAKARLAWGFAIANKRKRLGYKGLHIIIRVAAREAANIRKILEEGVS